MADQDLTTNLSPEVIEVMWANNHGGDAVDSAEAIRQMRCNGTDESRNSL